MAEVHNVLDAAFARLEEIPLGVHLFCPRVNESDDEFYEDADAISSLGREEKRQRIQDGMERLDSMYNCSLVLGLAPDAASFHRSEFQSRSNQFLKTCASCVRNWHKGRAAFLKDISPIYDDSVVDEMRDRLNQFDFERITNGLQAAEQFILAHNGIVSQSTFIKEGKSDHLISLYESLCCIAYLSTPENRKHFNYVFTTIQQRKPLKLDEILPAMTYFLFDENPTRRDFAIQTFERRPVVTASDFDWAIHDTLVDFISKTNSKSTDDSSLQRFWQGFLYIVDALEEDTIIECLRGMSVQPSIYELMILQMPQLQSAPVLRAVLKVFCGLVRKSPKAFWDAYSQWAPPAILEQIIRSPAFRPLLLQSGEHDMNPDGPAAISWVKPLIDSISPSQKTDVCDKLVHHLLGDFANDPQMSPEGRFACYRGAMEALSSGLAGFVSPKYRLHAGSSTIHTNALLNLTLKYKALIIQLAELPTSDPRQASMSNAALSVIRSALALDSRITAEEYNALQENDNHVQREVKRDSAGLWDSFLEILQPGALELAKAMLLAFVPLITVEIFRPLKPERVLSRIKAEFNAEFHKTAEVIGRVVERLEDFSQMAIGQLCLDPTTMYPIVATLIHGEEPISQAGTSLIKAITGEDRRSHAVQKMLGMHFVPVLSAYTRVINDVTGKKSLWSPQINILHYSRDILDNLSNPISGILRSKDLNIAEQDVLGKWWDSQWAALENSLFQTDAWSRKVEMETMKNFCREVMEHADALLAQDGLLASALNSRFTHTVSSIGDDESNKSMRIILEQPRIHCMGLCKMLRLKDYYLVTVIVNVLGKLLRRLREFSMELPGAPLMFIKDTCITTGNSRYKTMTNMNERQRAELIRSLGEEDSKDNTEGNVDDRIEIVSVRKLEGSKKQTKLDAWSKLSGETSSDKLPPKSDPKSSMDDVRESSKTSKPSSETNWDALEQWSAQNSASKRSRAKPTSTMDDAAKSTKPSKSAETNWDALEQWSAQSSASKRSRAKPTSTMDDAAESTKPSKSSAETNWDALEQWSAQNSASNRSRAKPTAASIDSIRQKRAKEAEEKRKRDAEAIARARALRAPKQTVAGEGSGLQGLSGVHGKEHAPAQRSEIMVNSSSEEEDDSDDAEFLRRTNTRGKYGDDANSRIQSMRLNPRGPVKKERLQRSAKDMRARHIPSMDLLHQVVLDWDIFHEGNDPPNGIRCSRVAASYTSPTAYKDAFLPLLINEAWREFITSMEESTAMSFELKILNRMTVDRFIEVSTTMPTPRDKEKTIGEGDIVLFSYCANPLEARYQMHCLARVWRIHYRSGMQEVQFRLSSRAGPILQTLVPQAELYGIKVTNMTTIEREYAALESLQYYDLAPEILEAKPSPMLSFSEDAVAKVMWNYELNSGQAKAILHVKENDGFTLVQGPPGTGKTKTIVAMIGALLGNKTQSGTSGNALRKPGGQTPTSSNGATKRLLVCAPSNAAVDELAMRLKAGVKTLNGTSSKINVVRLGRSEVMNPEVRDIALDTLVNARVKAAEKKNTVPSEREQTHLEAARIKEELAELRPRLEAAREIGDRDVSGPLQRQFDELKRLQARIGSKIDADRDSGNTAAREHEIRRRQTQQAVIDSAHVLCTTLSGSGHEMFKNLAVEFETVIIDEAAQCVELSALIPLKYGCSKCILVGDPKQLPPTVLSQSAARFGYDQSLFVRMQRNFPNNVHLLDTQYRMHPEISMFASQEFYEQRLLDGDGMANLRHQPWHQNELLGPYRFFDVRGIQTQGLGGRSLVNVEEVQVAMQLYEKLTRDYPRLDFKGKIGIITPYKAQLNELRERFIRRYGERIVEFIEFNTTDAFQGRECEIIMFSCVRATPTGGIGFMNDVRRMNVGLTRAKSSLWILGNSQALAQGQYWNRLVLDAHARNRYSGGDVLNMLRKPGARLAPLPPSVPAQLRTPAPAPAPPPPANPQVPTSVTESNNESNDRPLAHIPNVTYLETMTMEDITPAPTTKPDNKFKTPQLPETYELIQRNSHPNPRSGFGGLNERGEPAFVPRSTSDRPIIHESGIKRPNEDTDNWKPLKKAAKEIPSTTPPVGPRAMRRPQDPAAMALLGIPSNDSSAAGGASSLAPPNAPKGPSNPRPSIMPRRILSDPFIKRKPNRPR